MKMSKNVAQNVAINVASSLIGCWLGNKVNVAIDNKLAKSETPGMINKFTRWNLKVGRSPYWNAAVIVANAAATAYATAKMEEVMSDVFAAPVVTYRNPNDRESIGPVVMLKPVDHLTSRISGTWGESDRISREILAELWKQVDDVDQTKDESYDKFCDQVFRNNGADMDDTQVIIHSIRPSLRKHVAGRWAELCAVTRLFAIDRELTFKQYIIVMTIL